MTRNFQAELAATGEKLVQFGLNVFVQPKGFTFGKAHNIVEWDKQARARREELLESDSAFNTSSQELNPQNQKQQLTAKVETAKRPELAQLANQMFPTRPVKLEHLFDPAERKGAAQPQKPTAQQVSVVDLRERMKATIMAATGPQLKQLAVTVSSVVRNPSPKPGLSVAARPVIDRANNGSRPEAIAMYLALASATNSKPSLLDATGNMPKVKPAEQQLIEEQIRGHIRYATLALRNKPELMAKACREMMKAANKTQQYENEAAPSVAR